MDRFECLFRDGTVFFLILCCRHCLTVSPEHGTAFCPRCLGREVHSDAVNYRMLAGMLAVLN